MYGPEACLSIKKSKWFSAFVFIETNWILFSSLMILSKAISSTDLNYLQRKHQYGQLEYTWMPKNRPVGV